MSVIRRIPTLDEDGTFPERFVPTAIPQAVEDAQDAATEATTARDVTVAARGEAVAARDAAIAAKGASKTARDGAVAARDAAIAAKDGSETARDGAMAAKDLAVAARDTTLSAVVIMGAGRPDVPATLTTPGTAALVATATSGAEFRSIDGPQGAWVWRKRGSTWVCVEGDTGWRSVGDLPASVASAGTVKIRRANEVVDVLVEGLMWNNATPGQNVIPGGIALGSGFRPSDASARPLLSASDPDLAFFDNLVPYVPSGIFYLRWFSRMDRTSFLTNAVTSTKPLSGSCTWTTRQAWPATLPGTAI